MAAINIKVNGLDAAISKIDGSIKNIEKNIQGELNAWAIETATLAKQKAPTDEGHLKGSIAAEFGKMKASVTVAVNYAAYVEFGTRKFAAEYVGTLPADWQSFAALYKGKSGSGDYYDFLNNILDWVMRKGIANRYSVKTQKKVSISVDKPSKGGVGKDDYSRLHDAAYAIALSILRKGTRPHPFLYPAYQQTREKLIENIKKLIE